MKLNRKSKNIQGFTLVEILVVMAIAVLLLALVLGLSGRVKAKQVEQVLRTVARCRVPSASPNSELAWLPTFSGVRNQGNRQIFTPIQAPPTVANMNAQACSENIGMPVKLSETPGSVRSPSPLLGQHTDDVLSDMGCSEDEIAGLRAAGVIQ